MRFIIHVFMFFLVVCSWSLDSYAQSAMHITNQYNQKDGLSHSTIYDLYEDSRGFLWIATYEGLNRFDGLHFKSYYHHKQQSNSLAHNTVKDILEYQPGLLLIATANGLSVFNTILGKFENERIHHPPLSPGNGANVTNLHMDEDGNVWVNYNGELDVIDRDLNYQYTLTDLEWAASLKGSQITFEDWQVDADSMMWLSTDTSGIQIIDFKTKTVYNRHHNPKDFHFMQFKIIRALMIDKKQNILYVAPWGTGLYKYDLNNGKMLHQNFGQPLQELSSINAIVKLDNGQLLCSSNGTFYLVDPITLDFTRHDFQKESNEVNGHRRMHPITILKSQTDRYWIGANEGLFQIEKDNRQDEISLTPSTGISNCVDLMLASTGMVYALYENRTLIEVNSATGYFMSYKIPILKDDFVLQMCEDKQKQIWIATSRGVILFDMVSKKFITPKASIAALDQSFLTAIFCDRDGDIWIGTRQPFGLYHYLHLKDQLEKVEDETALKMGMIGEFARISSITQDKQENLWLRSAAGGGILKYDKSEKSWKRYPNEKDQVGLLENKGMYSVYPDDEGYVWVSTTAGDGLIRYDYQKNNIQQFNREDGLLSDHIFHISADEQQLWLTSEYGYSKFNLQDNTIVSHNWYNVTNPFDMVIDSSGDRMVIGMRGKLIFISTKENLSSLSLPVPLIDGIYVNHQEQYIDPQLMKLRLSHNQKNVTIDFTTAYYEDVDKVKFSYFLEGADQEWQYPRGTRTAQYAALSSGTYVFKIKAADPRGIWGQPIDAFTFTIVPPFWKTPWFVACTLLFITASIYWVLKKRVASVRYEASLKQKIAETEMMALRAQMNPHFIFNSLNSIDSLIHSDDKYQATLYLNKFARLIRNILDSSKQNTVPVEKDMDTLRLYVELEQFRSLNTFTSDIRVEPAISGHDIRVPPLIVQPYVENAIHHGLRNRADNKGHLQITLSRTADGLLYVIEDNGVGRQFSKNGRRHERHSYGMQMSSDRIMIFNQEEQASVKITDLSENGIPTGTKVEIKLKTT